MASISFKSGTTAMSPGGPRPLRYTQRFWNRLSERLAERRHSRRTLPGPHLVGLSAAWPIAHMEAFGRHYRPSHLIVLGGGCAEIELARIFRRRGSRVTIVEPGRQLGGRADAQAIGEVLIAEGIDLRTNAKPIAVMGRSGDVVTVKFRTAEGDKVIQGSDLLVAPVLP